MTAFGTVACVARGALATGLARGAGVVRVPFGTLNVPRVPLATQATRAHRTTVPASGAADSTGGGA
jgi:hypothetical protein